MNKTALFLGFFLLFAPTLALASTPSCSAQGYTVVFVNGVFDTELQAQDDKKALQDKLPSEYGNQPITVQLGYNPTHLAGAGDLLQSTAQEFNYSISDFDLDTVLNQIYPEVTTRKLLLVGHSQGAFYTNSMYYYLLAHGEPAEALSVYNVASPASATAGGGKYLNSSNDTLLTFLRDPLGFTTLNSNIDIPITTEDSNTNAWPGHSFTDAYLAGASTRIVSDLSGELSALVQADPETVGDCFTPPGESIGYKTEAAAFAVADPVASAVKVGTVAAVQAGAVALNTAATLATGALQLLSTTISINTTPPPAEQVNTATMKVVDKLYGSSLDGLSPQDKQELLGSSQGSAVVLAVRQKNTTDIGIVLGTSTSISTSTQTLPAPAPAGPIFDAAKGSSGNASEPAPVIAADDDAVITTDEATSTIVDDDTASTTDIVADTDATTTPVVTLPTGSPVVDDFDSYSGSRADSLWSVVPSPDNSNVLLQADSGNLDTFTTDPIVSDCHEGGCVAAFGSSGSLGAGNQSGFMYRQSDVEQDAGAFTIWARVRAADRASANVAICGGTTAACPNDYLFWFSDFAPKDDTWHQYYMAWRQGAASVETCLLQDDTNPADCAWNSSGFALGTQFNGIVLEGGVARPDLGDEVWFDDLADAPQQ